MASLIVAAAVAFTAIAGVAQIPTSTQDVVRSTSDPSRSELALGDQVFRDLVACVVRYQPGRTRNLLETIPATHQEFAIVYSFESRMETCYDAYRTGGRAMTFRPHLLRGFIAENYYRRDFPAGISLANEVAADQLAAWTQPRARDGRITQMEMLHSMARCVTARQPATVGTMLRAAPLSAEEGAAIRALQPDLSACLDSGVEFTASRQGLRGLLAEAAFHYAAAQRNGFGTVGRPDVHRD